MNELPASQPQPGTPTEQRPAPQDEEDAARAEDAERASSAPPAPRRLTRRMDRRVLGGVASGLADYFGVDPVIPRLGFVAFGFLTGPLAIVLYAIAWIIVPGHDDPRGRERGPRRGVAPRVWIAVAVAALLLLPPFLRFFWFFTSGESGLWRPGLFWALMLIGVGVLLFRRSETAGSGAVEGWGAPAAPESGEAPVEHEPRRRSILGRLVLAAALLLVGAAALLDNLGVRAVGDHIAELLLLLAGAGLLVGAWWGRARWLIVVGALLAAGLFAVDALPIHDFDRFWVDGFGYRSARPVSRDAVAEPFELGMGQLWLDLTALPLSPQPTRVNVSVGAGKIEVIVPEGSDVTVDAAAKGGNIEVFGEERDGSGLRVETERLAGPDDQRLALDLQAGYGEIVVREAAPGERFPGGRFREDGFPGERRRDRRLPGEGLRNRRFPGERLPGPDERFPPDDDAVAAAA